MSILDRFFADLDTGKWSTSSRSYYDHFDWDESFYVTAVNEDGHVFAGFMVRAPRPETKPAVRELEAA